MGSCSPGGQRIVLAHTGRSIACRVCLYLIDFKRWIGNPNGMGRALSIAMIARALSQLNFREGQQPGVPHLRDLAEGAGER